jgi:hypothetical protein
MPIVLLFNDTSRVPYTYSAVAAKRVVSTQGHAFYKDMTFNRTLQITDTTTATQHVYKRVGDATSEVARTTYSTDVNAKSGSVAVSVVDNDVMKQVFGADSTQVVVTTGSVATTINETGIAFTGNDEAAIHFGPKGQFKIAYRQNELTIQSRNEDNTYKTQIAFTR